MDYTKKYWCMNAHDLETNWIGGRLSQPDIDTILHSALEENTKNDYYASEMRYPATGGFEAFLTPLRQGLDIRLNKKIIGIDPEKKEITFVDGALTVYDSLISTIPLPELCRTIKSTPAAVMQACENLAWTKGIIFSYGLKNISFPFEKKDSDAPPVLWLYVYDTDIPFARAYFPARKSPGNAPNGYGSIQVECYLHGRDNPPLLDVLCEKVTATLEKMQILSRNDILFIDTQEKEYANVIFDHNIYDSRKLVHDYLGRLDIVYAGRFGEWDYLWSDQSVLSGLKAAEKIIMPRGS